jgi:hypothetical protein
MKLEYVSQNHGHFDHLVFWIRAMMYLPWFEGVTLWTHLCSLPNHKPLPPCYPTYPSPWYNIMICLFWITSLVFFFLGWLPTIDRSRSTSSQSQIWAYIYITHPNTCSSLYIYNTSKHMLETYNVIHVFKSLYFHPNNSWDHYLWLASQHAITPNLFHSSLCWTCDFLKQMYTNFANPFHCIDIPVTKL